MADAANPEMDGTLSMSMINNIETDLLKKMSQEEADKIQENIEDNLLYEAINAEEFIEDKGKGMLDYEKQMFLDIVHVDGLVVCAKGISYDKVLLNLIKLYCDESKIILVLNSSDYEERLYRKLLGNEIVRDIPANQNDRQVVYNDGGVIFISTQVIVVDLLKNKIPIESITGIIVLRAHYVVESCQEAFALRLFRHKNKIGFIKAFSNNVEAFTYGYGHVEKVMRNLFIRELFIWPRFHSTIQKSLKPYEPQVIEIQVPMTTKMVLIQTHILDIMNFTVKELKRINRFLDLQEITVENCVTKNFHKILQAQLDTVWHQLSSHTKLLVSDLKVLRSLIMSTIYNDSVTLYTMMKKYRTSEYAMSNSGWVLLDAAEQMFKITKERVYNSNEEFEPELPTKWKVLHETLRIEIPADLKNIARKNVKNENPSKSNVKVLILCNDARTCYQLSQFLTDGGEKYLFYTAIRNDVPIKSLSEKYKNCQSIVDPMNVVKVKTYFDQSAAPSMMPPAKSIPEAGKANTKKEKGFLKDRIKDKLEEQNESKEQTLNDQILSEVEEEEYAFQESYILTMSQLPDNNVTDDSSDYNLNSTIFENGNFQTLPTATEDNLDITSVINTTPNPIVFIRTFKSDMNGVVSLERTLAEIDPKYIIMYNANITAIRQIEIHEARQKRHPDNRLRVFFLLHIQTVEEQSYLTTLRREKKAFELLIDTKVKMVVPEYQDGKTDEIIATLNKSSDEKVSTRNAGGQETTTPKEPPKIIVDIREFRSDLPCLIHRRGIELLPVMITVGDYILTPEICVERKSISDLIGSLNSGRLYNQCIQMQRFYAKPILLIEFDQNKPFHLQGHYMISSDVASTSNTNITSKLQLLTLHFPKLKLVWSPSPYATAKLFEELKLGKPEPDPNYASAIGNAAGEDIEILNQTYNTQIYDFLLKLPGITPNNIRKILTNFKTVKEITLKSQEELETIMGESLNAKLLWEILHIAHKPVESDPDKNACFKKGGGAASRGNFRKRNR